MPERRPIHEILDEIADSYIQAGRFNFEGNKSAYYDLMHEAHNSEMELKAILQEASFAIRCLAETSIDDEEIALADYLLTATATEEREDA